MLESELELPEEFVRYAEEGKLKPSFFSDLFWTFPEPTEDEKTEIGEAISEAFLRLREEILDF